MEKTSTHFDASSNSDNSAIAPRRSTIERLRQLARATFPTPLGIPVIIN
ncbi:hypothetical protein [Duncaniella muris]|nr:hypothetical protein [Duncaniella muris]